MRFKSTSLQSATYRHVWCCNRHVTIGIQLESFGQDHSIPSDHFPGWYTSVDKPSRGHNHVVLRLLSRLSNNAGSPDLFNRVISQTCVWFLESLQITISGSQAPAPGLVIWHQLVDKFGILIESFFHHLFHRGTATLISVCMLWIYQHLQAAFHLRHSFVKHQIFEDTITSALHFSSIVVQILRV